MIMLKYNLYFNYVFFVVNISVFAGPLLSIDLTSTTADADFVCLGKVVSIQSQGKETVVSSARNVNVGTYEAEILRARISVKRVFKGEKQDEILLECYRNLQAWVPGIAEGTYILFLKQKGTVFVPVQQPGFLVPVDDNSLRSEDDAIVDILKSTVAGKNNRLLRPAIAALTQLMSPNDYRAYLKNLLDEEDSFVQGIVILELVRFGDKDVYKRARFFANVEYDNKELNNLAREISIAIQQTESTPSGNAD